MIVQLEENSILATSAMGVIRKILIFLVLTAGIIVLGRLVPRILPPRSQPSISTPTVNILDSLRDSTNALPEVVEDTTGGKWQQKLFIPLLRSYGLPEKHLKPKRGFFEIVFPKGKPIHEYALEIEKLCHQNEILVEQGVELHPTGQRVEYLLQSNGQHIKLRASLGSVSMAGSAKLALVFIALDSIKETELAALESASWDKSLVVNAYSSSETLKKLRFTSARNEVLIELPMEPSTYPYLDPGKHALFIHHTQEEVDKILTEGFDSLPKATGFVSKYGDRAIENGPLLEKLFKYTSEKSLVFLDLTGSQRSLSRQSAAAQGAHSRTVQPFRNLPHVDLELALKALQAQKTGEAILVLPYSPSAFHMIEKSLVVNADHFRELGVKLVTLSALLSIPDESALAKVMSPVQKPKPVVTPPKIDKVVPKVVPKLAPKVVKKPVKPMAKPKRIHSP